MHRTIPWLTLLVMLHAASARAHTPDQPLGDPVVRVTFESDGSSTHPLAGHWAETEGLLTVPVHVGTEGAPQGQGFGRLAVRSEGASSARYVIETVMRPGVFLEVSAFVRAPERPEGVSTQLALVISDAYQPSVPVTEICLDIPPGDEWKQVEATLDPIRLAGPTYYLSSVEFRAEGLESGQAVAIDLDDLLFSGDVDLYFEEYLPRLADEGAARIRASLAQVKAALDDLPPSLTVPGNVAPPVRSTLEAAGRWYSQTRTSLAEWMASLSGQSAPPPALARAKALDAHTLRSVARQFAVAATLNQRGPYAIWRLAETQERYPLPWDPVVPGELVDRVSLRGSPGETIHLVLSIRPQDQADRLILRPGPLVSDAGPPLPPSAWNAYHLLWWWQASAGAVNGELVPTPELLARDPLLVQPSRESPDNQLSGSLPSDAPRLKPADIAAGELGTFVLELSIPTGFPPGHAGGEILIASNAGEARIPCDLEVLPFVIADRDPLAVIELRSRLGQAQPLSVAALPEDRMRQVLADIRAMGVRAITLDAPIPEEPGDLTELRRALALRLEMGTTEGPVLLHGTEPWLMNIAGHAYSAVGFAEHNGAFVTRMRQVIDLANELGINGLTICGMPSAGTPLAHHQNVAAKACQTLGLPTYIEAQPGISHATAHMAYVSLCRDDPIDAQSARRMGFELWYRPSWAGLEDPASLRLESGFSLPRRGYTRFIAPYWQPSGNPFDDTDSVAKDRMLAYPSPTGVVRTIGWLGLQEAVKDRQYLLAAEELLDQARRATGAGGFGARPQVPEITALLTARTACLETHDPAAARQELQAAMTQVAIWLRERP